jgi:ABC-2 type transport system ATP-binding protein
MAVAGAAPVVRGRDITKHFRRAGGEIVHALDGVSLEITPGSLAALVGPDGAGKTTLLRLAAGLLVPNGGSLQVLGIDVARDPQAVQSRIAYMPQRFGLYEDLTVRENLDLYADLRGVANEERRTTYPRLMEMTALGPFTRRLAGDLSGGMKQKLGLACTLVRSPELLLLDEPTVGVDPLSRRELWEILRHLISDQHLTVLLSTSYLDEAQWCNSVLVMHEGRVLAQGAPKDVSALADGRSYLAEPPTGEKARDLQARLLGDAAVVDAVPEGGLVRVVYAGLVEPDAAPVPGLEGIPITPTPPRFEDGFMILLGRVASQRPGATQITADEPAPVPAQKRGGTEAEVEVHDLVRQFGTFTAVDHVSFDVQRGEIFGLLGPNGAGKTTTFRMLCGLLAATAGTLRVAGVDVRSGGASARRRIGYVAQKFSLYAQLSVTENLDFFAGAYGLRGDRKRDRVAWALRQFELQPLAGQQSGRLPGGFKQRLAMAAALLHEPETLFLDEPTSGADPQARRDFWRRITMLAAGGVTAIVTTHFMEEAEYCDRIAVMDAGHILAQGTPAEIRRRAGPTPGRESTMEDAFIAIVEKSRDGGSPEQPRALEPA